MSGKTRAFAFVVGTAALVALSAPMAHAATLSDPNSGFNNDSIVNTTGNQVPLQACNNDIPVNAGFLVGQVPLAGLSGLLGLGNSGNVTSEANRDCTQTPTQSDPSTTTTTSTSSAPANVGDHQGSSTSSDPNSGFNNDSIVNTSNNQVPLQACNNDIPVNAGVGAVQVPVDQVSGALGILSSGSSTSTANRDCTQTPTQSNPSTTTSTSSNS